MSYILDALRKADAQRERDPGRGIHAQPVRLAAGEQRRDGYGIGFWAAMAAGLAALASVGGYLYRDSGALAIVPPAPAEVVAAAPAPALVVPSAEAPAAAVLPPPVLTPPPVVLAPPIAAKAPVVQAPPVAAPAPPVRKAEAASGPAATAGQGLRNSTAGVATGAAAPAQSAPATAPPAASTPQPAAGPAVADATPPVPGLPADAPKLAISGGVYSTNAAQRMLIVNGQVFNEGGEVGTGVVLEEIRPKAAVLRFRGSRYTVSY